MEEEKKPEEVEEKKPEEVEEKKPEETVKAQQVGQIYIRLEGIYEADVEVEPGKHIQAFLLCFTDLGGTQFMCPLTCKELYKDSMRKQLGRLTPLHLAFNLKETEKKENGSGQVVDVTDMSADREVH
jgi:hypothetical protein